MQDETLESLVSIPTSQRHSIPFLIDGTEIGNASDGLRGGARVVDWNSETVGIRQKE